MLHKLLSYKIIKSNKSLQLVTLPKYHLWTLLQMFMFFCVLKVHFVIHSLNPYFPSTEVEIFTSVEAFKYIMFVCKIFLANSFVWQNNHQIVDYVNMKNTQHI